MAISQKALPERIFSGAFYSSRPAGTVHARSCLRVSRESRVSECQPTSQLSCRVLLCPATRPGISDSNQFQSPDFSDITKSTVQIGHFMIDSSLYLLLSFPRPAHVV